MALSDYIEALPGDAQADLRRRAAERVVLPTRKSEAWRYTDLRPLQQQFFAPAAAAPVAVDPRLLAPLSLGVDSHRIVLVNGRYEPFLSHADAAFVKPLAEHLELLADAPVLGPFAALNTALATDGVLIEVPAGRELKRPIELIHWGFAAAPLSSHARIVVRLGAGASATIVETFAGQGAYWTNTVADIVLGEKAVLRHVKLQHDDEGRAVHLAAVRAEIGEGAAYDSFVLALGARLSRHDLVATMSGKDACCAANGAYLLRGQQEATLATLIEHAAPSCRTREVVKGVVDDRAHGVFQGKIVVRPDAQKTDAHQLNRNLLLSPRAVVDTKPELEIYADDVKCSHGATIGDLDETQLFYLRARGIAEAQARRMLIDAFAREAIDMVEDLPARLHLERHLARWLAMEDGR